MAFKDSHNYLQIAADCAHHGILEILDGAGRRRWELTCGHCGKSTNHFRADVKDGAQIINHFARGKWVLARNRSPYCSRECAGAARLIEKEQAMSPKPNGGSPPVPQPPNPVIMRRVITLLNDQFDMDKRLYREGYSDERIAKEAETSVDFVVMQRRGAYGELAEDPMIATLRSEVASLRQLMEEETVKMRQTFDAQIKEVDYKIARLIGHHKAGG